MQIVTEWLKLAIALAGKPIARWRNSTVSATDATMPATLIRTIAKRLESQFEKRQRAFLNSVVKLGHMLAQRFRLQSKKKNKETELKN